MFSGRKVPARTFGLGRGLEPWRVGLSGPDPSPGTLRLNGNPGTKSDPPGGLDFTERYQLQVITATPLGLSETLKDAH